MLFVALLVVVIGSIGLYVYLIKKVDINLLIKIVAGIFIIVLGVWMRLKYLKWKRGDL